MQQVWCKRDARCDHRLAAWGVEPGHEVAVRGPGGGEVLGAFLELQTEVDGLLFEVGDLHLELVDVGWARRVLIRARLSRRCPGTGVSPVVGSWQ